MNIVVAGVMGRYPYGGVAWCSMMYLIGLRQLGHNVWYLEDTKECNFDPIENTLSKDPRYALAFIRSCLEPYELDGRWCYVNYLGTEYFGHTRDQWRQVCQECDLFINLSGGCWTWREEYLAIPHTVFIDSDPAFTQLEVIRRGQELVEFFGRYDHLFTFGRNIGTPASSIPTWPLNWNHTWQPICIDEWKPSATPPRPFFTTVMTWKTESFKEIGGNKDQEFKNLIHLPSVTSVPVELAVSAPHGSDVCAYLNQFGWACRDAFAVSHNPIVYRDFIRSSTGEFSVAKHTYVKSNSGWFSDRTECYLASGRPAVVQDTGFSAHLPTGCGLFAYRTVEEAATALEEIIANYDRHCRVAHDIAIAHFSAKVVLTQLIEKATSNKSSLAHLRGPK
jgi:hypothetical protein